MSDEVLVLVRRGDDWLVLHRAPERGGYWHTVAGGVEPGEADAAAAARELHEEVGLDARPAAAGRTFSYVPEDWEPRTRPADGPVSVACFVADAPAGWEPTLDAEHDAYRWCTAAAAAELLLWPEPRAVLEDVAGGS